MIASTISGWMLPAELEWIAARARLSAITIEIGVWKGRSTAAWCEHTSGVVFAVDDWRPERTHSGSYQELYANGREQVMAQARENLGQFLDAGRLVIVEHEAAAAATLLRDMLKWRKADTIFVDGNHAIAAVAEDLRNYLPLLKPGGLMCGHDWHEVLQGVLSVLPGASPVCEEIWAMEIE